MHRVVGKLISKTTMMQTLQVFIYEIKSYVSKPKAI
jgi:hypothetical protein